MTHRAAAVGGTLVVAALAGVVLGERFGRQQTSAQTLDTRTFGSGSTPEAAEIKQAWLIYLARSDAASDVGWREMRALFQCCGILGTRAIRIEDGKGYDVHAVAHDLDYLAALTRLGRAGPTPVLLEISIGSRRVLVGAHAPGSPVAAWVSPQLLNVTK